MASSQYESKSIMKTWRDGRGGECEEVLSFEKALVYCWRACIYFMPPQIVGKGRADSFGVIREVETESERELCHGELLCSDTLSPVSPPRPRNALSLAHNHRVVKY